MTLDAALTAVVSAAVAPLAAELRGLRAEVAALRAASPSKWLSQQRAAELLDVDVQTIRAMRDRGELVFRKAGRRIVIDSASLKPADPAEISRLAAEARS